MKVAVCLSGQMRTVKTCAPVIKRYFEAHSPDYYLHTWTHNTWTTSKPAALVTPQDKLPQFVPVETRDFVLDTFKPVAHRIDQLQMMSWSVSQSQQFSFMESNKLRKASGKDYDVVVKCRMDIIWHPEARFSPASIVDNFLYVSLEFQDYLGYPMVTDRCFYGTPATMDKVSDLYQITKLRTRNVPRSYGKDHESFVHTYLLPEQALHTHCRDNGIQVIREHPGGPSNAIDVIVRREVEERGLDPVADFWEIRRIQNDLWNADDKGTRT